jgi:hypothetical protein
MGIRKLRVVCRGARSGHLQVAGGRLAEWSRFVGGEEQKRLIYHYWRLVPATVFILAAGLCLAGCSASGNRNIRESIVVTTSRSLVEGSVKCALELRDRREEFTLSDTEAFLQSERAAKLSYRLKSELVRRREAVRRTIEQARDELVDDCLITRPDPQRPYSKDNIVVYLAGKTDIRVLFLTDEIGQLLAFNEVADDLATIRYTHPDFDPKRLSQLRDQVVALGLNVENVAFSGANLEERKTAAAARILERHLRERGVGLSDDLPLLTSGPVTATRSPKLSAAMKDGAVLERVVRSNDPNLTRALIRLVRLNVVELQYP